MKNKNKKNPLRHYLAGTQVAATVFVSAFIGHKIDELFAHQTHIITIVFAALSIFYALYSLIKDVNGQK